MAEWEHGKQEVPVDVGLASGRFAMVTWYWSVGKVELEEPDHNCSPDCEHWKEEKE